MLVLEPGEPEAVLLEELEVVLPEEPEVVPLEELGVALPEELEAALLEVLLVLQRLLPVSGFVDLGKSSVGLQVGCMQPIRPNVFHC